MQAVILINIKYVYSFKNYTIVPKRLANYVNNIIIMHVICYYNSWNFIWTI